MKETFYKTIALLLSLIVLFSTLSFTVDMHYCGNRLVDVALFKKAESCQMKSFVSVKPCAETVKKKSCCSDKQIVFEAQDDLKNPVMDLSFGQETFFISYFYSFVSLLKNNATQKKINIVGHSPPILHKDFQILYESFLI